MNSQNKLKIELQQHFDVPVEKLYEAWTNPEHLKQWWKPIENKLQEVTNELREGGKVEYIFEENKLHISGNYIKVKENELLQYTWNWELPDDAIRNSPYKLTIQFRKEDNGSSIHVTQDAFTNEEGMLPHQQGWKKGLNDLSEYLSGA